MEICCAFAVLSYRINDRQNQNLIILLQLQKVAGLICLEERGLLFLGGIFFLIFSYNKLHITLTLLFLAFDDLLSGLERFDKLQFELDELFIELDVLFSSRNEFKSLMEQFSGFPHVSPNFDLIPDSNFPQLNLKGQEP